MSNDKIERAIEDIENGLMWGSLPTDNSLKLAIKALEAWNKVHKTLYEINSDPQSMMKEMRDLAIIRTHFKELEI